MLRRFRFLGNTWLLMLVGAALLYFSWATRETRSKAEGGHPTYSQFLDGTWHPTRFDATFMQCGIVFVFRTEWHYGIGWERLAAFRDYKVEVGPDPNLTPEQLTAIERDIWPDERSETFQDELEWPLHRRWNAMLRDGVQEQVVGVTYYIRQWTPWVGLAFLAFTMVRGGVRARRYWLAWIQMSRIEEGRCGKCKYPFPIRETRRGTCSECGADIDADAVLATARVRSGGRI